MKGRKASVNLEEALKAVWRSEAHNCHRKCALTPRSFRQPVRVIASQIILGHGIKPTLMPSCASRIKQARAWALKVDARGSADSSRERINTESRSKQGWSAFSEP